VIKHGNIGGKISKRKMDKEELLEYLQKEVIVLRG